MTRLSDLDPGDHLRDPARKQRYVTAVFDTIAPRYDRFTRWFSFGMDARWKRELVTCARAALPPEGGIVLDLAGGTGDLARGVRGDGAGSAAEAVVVDVSRPMLRAGRTREGRSPIAFACGDMMALPVASGSVDVVTVGYGMRNVPVLDTALREVARVLKPGGRLFTLDFFPPPGRVWRVLYLRYLRLAGRAVGWAWHRDPDTYAYIARSIGHWVPRERYEQAVAACGFTVEWVRPKLAGGICLHGARRRA